MQILFILPYIDINMQNMQNYMQNMQNMPTRFQYAEYALPTLLMRHLISKVIWNPIHMDKNGQIGMYQYILVHDGTTWYILTYFCTYLYILVHTKIIFSRMVHTCMYCILTPSHILHCGAVIWCASNTGPLSHAQHMILFCLK